MNFVEVRSDLGGARIGLEAAGHTCISSITWNEIISGRLNNFCDEVSHLRDCDILTIQSPANETVNGFWAANGTWVCARDVVDVARKMIHALDPNLIVITGRKSILSERFGTSFSELLVAMGELGYATCWVNMCLSSLGIPQHSRRVILVAKRIARSPNSGSHDIIAQKLLDCVLSSISGRVTLGIPQDVRRLIDERSPRPGLQAPQNANPFASVGISWGGNFRSGHLEQNVSEGATPTLSAILGIETAVHAPVPLSVRFVSRRGEKGLQIKHGGRAHSVGPAISAWPLLAVPSKSFRSIGIGAENYNWRCSFESYCVLRLTPARTLMLFGQHAERLIPNVIDSDLSISDRYKAVSATVPPILLARLGEALRSKYFDRRKSLKEAT